MNVDEIYQEAFEDELGKVAAGLPKPESIRKAINLLKKIKQNFGDKYESNKKKKRKRKKRSSFFGK